MTSVEDFMKTPMGSVPKPPLHPKKTWFGTVTGHEIVDKKDMQGNDAKAVRVKIKTKIPGEDVDPDELANYGDLGKAFVSQDYLLNETGRRQFDQLLLSIFGENTSGATWEDYLAILVDRDVMYEVTHTVGKKAGDDGEFPVYVNVRSLKGVPRE